MIRAAASAEALLLFGDTAFGCRIRAAAAAYGLNAPFARFWTQDRRAAVCRIDDAAVLDAFPDADFAELSAFLRAAGAGRLLCSEPAARQMGFSRFACAGEVMAFSGEAPPVPPAFETDPGPREIHALLKACEGPAFRVPEFEPFYLDLSHRTRHGAAFSAGIRKDGRLAACTVCTAFTEKAAVLSALAVLPEERRRGLGSSVLAAVVFLLGKRRSYLFRADGENEAFYRGFGFRSCGRFAEIEL